MEKLSRHFNRAEFEMHARIPDNALAVCSMMCGHILEAIRAEFNEPYFVTSGYRPYIENREVGGVECSEHIYTEDQCASDGYLKSKMEDMRPVFDWVRNQSDLEFDQIILEHGQNSDILHVGYSFSRIRREALEGLTNGKSKVYRHWDVAPFIPPTINAA